MNAVSERMLKQFSGAHLTGDYKAIAMKVEELAKWIAEDVDSNNDAISEEIHMGLRKLLEAQECFVRAKAGHLGAK